MPRNLLWLRAPLGAEEYSGEGLRLAGSPRRPAEGIGGCGGTPPPAPGTGALPGPEWQRVLHGFSALSRTLLPDFFRCRALANVFGGTAWFLLAVGTPSLRAAATTVGQWAPHEITLTAAQEHRWWEFPVRVTFRREDDAAARLTVEGCWDGERRWLVRVALPQPGRWTWRSQSADTGLDGKSGALDVRAPDAAELATNPNRRGQIRIAADRRHFEYADGTPFLLLASTLWAANTTRCGLGPHEDGPFFTHLADRQAKGFTTILLQYFHGYGDYPDSPGHRNEGGKPYVDIAAKELNPAFFQLLDVRLRALWERGFAVAIPATWWGKTKQCVFTPEDARRMSAYCAVRYGACNALWSLSGEYQYAFKDCGWTPADFTALGAEVQRHNPTHRPLSIHPSGQITWPAPHHVQSSRPFHGEAWLDHHWLQTGQSRDRLWNIVTRLAENRALTPARPVFCSEAFYERAEDAERAYHTRWQVWTALLNGAAGFGYGAEGLWQFFDPADPEGETGKKIGRQVRWQEAQHFEGSTQILPARTFLSGIDWWNLTPARERIRVAGAPNPLPTKTDLTPPQAAATASGTWVVYVPRGNAGRALALAGAGAAGRSARWFDPRRGEFVGHPVALGGVTLPSAPIPAEEDWVLLIAPKS